MPFRVTNMDSFESREFDVGDPKMPGWYEYIKGWSIGPLDSLADITISEPLTGVQIGVFNAGHQVVCGTYAPGATLPAIGRATGGTALIDQEKRTIYLRVDGRPFHIGRHLIESVGQSFAEGYRPVPGELLFEFLVGHNRVRCELCDGGPMGAVEAQFYENEEFRFSQGFDTRAQAIEWAELVGEAIKKDGA